MFRIKGWWRYLQVFPNYGNYFGAWNCKGGYPVDELDWAAREHDVMLANNCWDADIIFYHRLLEIDVRELQRPIYGRFCTLLAIICFYFITKGK